MTILRSVFLPGALAAALVLPVNALAQQPTTPLQQPQSGMCGERHEGEHHRGPLAALNLTPAQKAQIKQIRRQYRQAHPCGSQPDRAARAQMRQQILNVLTPAQRAQLQAERNGQRPY